MSTYDRTNSLSDRTEPDGPAAALEGPACTAIVRAISVLCFFFSRPVSASFPSVFRFGGMVSRVDRMWVLVLWSSQGASTDARLRTWPALSSCTRSHLAWATTATMSTTMLPPLRCCVSAARTTSIPASRRLLATSQVLRDAATPNLGTVPPPKKPIGAFRGGCVPCQARRLQRAHGKRG